MGKTSHAKDLTIENMYAIKTALSKVSKHVASIPKTVNLNGALASRELTWNPNRSPKPYMVEAADIKMLNVLKVPLI